MDISDRTGSLTPGKQADIVLCDINNYTDLFYHFGINHVQDVWIRGEQVVTNKIYKKAN